MFTIEKYKILFKRRWHEPRIKMNGITPDNTNGRYDTICEIYNISDLEVSRHIGIARLHPNDQPDKIVGKKIALQNAIGTYDSTKEEWFYNCADFYNKSVRKAMWKAFWDWVESWDKKNNET